MVSTRLKNISQNGFIFPKVRGENKKFLKPSPSYGWWALEVEVDWFFVEVGDLLLLSDG